MVLGYFMARRRGAGVASPPEIVPLSGLTVSDTSIAASASGAFATLAAVDGIAPFTFSLVSGPAWLTVVDDELVADGTQTTGSEDIVLSVEDSQSDTFTTDPITITISEPVLTYVTQLNDTNAGTSYTFSDAAIGDNPGINRRVILGIFGDRRSATSGDTSFGVVSIAGETATIHIEQASAQITQDSPWSFPLIGFASAFVSAGTTGDIVINFSQTVQSCRIAIWEVIDAHSDITDTAFDTDLSGTGTYKLARALAARNNGFVLAVGVAGDAGNNAVTMTWDGVSADAAVTNPAPEFSDSNRLEFASGTTADERKVVSLLGAATVDWASFVAMTLSGIGDIVEPGEYSDTTVLQANFDGTDGATSADDVSIYGNTLTFVDNAQLDTAQQKFGTASLLLDGSGDRVTVPHTSKHDLAGSDFTIEMWFRFNSTAGTQRLISKYSATTSDRGWILTPSATGITFQWWTSGSSSTAAGTVSGSWTKTTLVWYHVAVVRNGNVITIYGDGVEIASAAITDTIFASDTVLRIGNLEGGGETQFFNGWIDDLRIVLEAVYTEEFTPPTEAHPNP